MDVRQAGKKNLVRDGEETKKECEKDDLDMRAEIPVQPR